MKYQSNLTLTKIRKFSKFLKTILKIHLQTHFTRALKKVFQIWQLKNLLKSWVHDVAPLPLNLSWWRRSLSYRNQSINLLCKLMDWFLYDSDFHHERVILTFNYFPRWHILSRGVVSIFGSIEVGELKVVN